MGKLPSLDLQTSRVKKDIESTLEVADVLNGKKPVGGLLGKKFNLKPINTTQEFEQFLRDAVFLLQNYTRDGKSFSIQMQRLRTPVSELRKRKVK